jgi:hypothetical protein
LDFKVSVVVSFSFVFVGLGVVVWVFVVVAFMVVAFVVESVGRVANDKFVTGELRINMAMSLSCFNIMLNK